jgi:hypothetical protein
MAKTLRIQPSKTLKIQPSVNVTHLGIALLGLASAAGEDNEAALVLLQARNVGLQALDGPVLAAVVDADADSARGLRGSSEQQNQSPFLA